MTALSSAKSNASRLLLENISRVSKCAELLAAKRQYGPAIHLMMAAREECVKWIVLYCWEHLDSSTKRKLYNHMFKHELGGIFHFLSGRLEVAELFAAMTESLRGRDPEWDKAASAVASFLHDVTENFDPESLSEQIQEYLYGIDRTGYDDQYKEWIIKLERDRTGSIYVDFDQQFHIARSPSSFKLSHFKRYRNDVALARYYIDRLRGRRPNREILYRLIPKWKSELKDNLRRFKRHMQDGQKQNTPH
jgi:AbiV family abortive infection protein